MDWPVYYFPKLSEDRVDFVSGENLREFSLMLKNNFVDCFTQDFGADPFAEFTEMMMMEMAQHVIPGTMRRSGSRAEETMTPVRVGDTYNFQADNDFMYVIDTSCLNDSMYTKSTCNPGFVKVMLKSKEQLHDIIKGSLVNDGDEFFISPSKIKENVRIGLEIIQDIASATGMEMLHTGCYKFHSVVVGPSVRLICIPLDKNVLPSLVGVNDEDSLESMDEDAKNSEVDFVPSFKMNGWPEQAKAWLTRDRKWPPDDLVHKIAESGYHLVPKPCTKQTENIEWRISQSQAEGMLLTAVHKYSWCKQCYRILKCVIKYHLSRPNLISSYHCKTLFLWTLERYPPETWDAGNLGDRYLALIDELLHAVVQRQLPQYFTPEDNLFKHLGDDFADTVAKVLSNMRRRPIEFATRHMVVPWDDTFQGMTIEEMLSWNEKPEEERYLFSSVEDSAIKDPGVNAHDLEVEEVHVNDSRAQDTEDHDRGVRVNTGEEDSRMNNSEIKEFEVNDTGVIDSEVKDTVSHGSMIQSTMYFNAS